ncbi:MAG: TetR/AcrR family transcriptional regulator [Deltaproteobacteria bacterium]|nr:TetR/AcrR family transcriptional regulator [Deltaproteobacteria bacterium]
MARRRPSDRLQQVIDAAIEVFIGKGYRRAQMSDVARAAGVSQGSLYNYVESKEALFYLIIDRGFTDAPLPAGLKLPVETPSLADTLARLRVRIISAFALPELERAFTRSSVADPRAELETIVRQYYAGVERVGRGLDLVERSAVDLPELAQLFYIERRRSLIAQLAKYLESRIEMGAIRSLPDVPTAARLILETVVWFARHRHNSPDSAMISKTAALETTVDFLVSGLLASPAPTTSAKPKENPQRSQLHASRKLQ